jgi:hypothetical protein
MLKTNPILHPKSIIKKSAVPDVCVYIYIGIKGKLLASEYYFDTKER